MLSPDFEAQANSAIKEYFECCGYSGSIGPFLQECTSKGKTPDYVFTPNSQEKAVILEAFASGDADAFVREWNSLCPSRERPEIHQIEFMAQVYFGLFPLFENKSSFKLQETMNRFQSYLASLPQHVYNTTQFLRYYALPYLPNPQSHPSFQELFDEEWRQNLKQRIEMFLDEFIQQRATLKEPWLLQMMKSPLKSSTSMERLNYSEQLQAENSELKFKEASLNEKITAIQLNYSSLLAITSELVQVLAGAVNGTQISPEYMMDIFKRFSAFKNSSQLSSAKGSPRKPPAQSQPLVVKPQPVVKPSGNSLDYTKIKQELAKDNSELVKGLIAVFESAKTLKEKQQIVMNWCNSDIANSIVAKLLTKNESLLDSLKFIEIFSEFPQGRSYLLEIQELTHSLVQLLRSEKQDSPIKQATILILQRLSLRRQGQSILNSMDLIFDLQIILSDHEKLSEFTLNFSLSLLLNLCMRSSGRFSCTPFAETILGLLPAIANYESPEIQMYVFGILFNLLQETPIAKTALEMNYNEVLWQIRGWVDPNLVNQIDLILGKLDFIRSKLENNEDDDDLRSLISEDGDELDDFVDSQGNEKPFYSEQERLEYSKALAPFYTLQAVPIIKTRPSLTTTTAVGSSSGRPMTPSSHGLSRTSRPSSRKDDFSTGFGTRSKIARTPISNSQPLLNQETSWFSNLLKRD